MVGPMLRRQIKVLYLENGLDEKSSAKMLAGCAASHLPWPCVFTVVPNGFVALDFADCTCYDVIIADFNLPQLNAIEVVQILRNVGEETPLVVVATSSEDQRLLMSDECRPYVARILRKPYYAVDLCRAIEEAIGVSSLPTQSNSASTSEDSLDQTDALQSFISVVQSQLSHVEGIVQHSPVCAADWQAYQSLGLTDDQSVFLDMKWSGASRIDADPLLEYARSPPRTSLQESKRRRP